MKGDRSPRPSQRLELAPIRKGIGEGQRHQIHSCLDHVHPGARDFGHTTSSPPLTIAAGNRQEFTLALRELETHRHASQRPPIMAHPDHQVVGNPFARNNQQGFLPLAIQFDATQYSIDTSSQLVTKVYISTAIDINRHRVSKELTQHIEPPDKLPGCPHNISIGFHPIGGT